jgi:hypothetical protein
MLPLAALTFSAFAIIGAVVLVTVVVYLLKKRG